MTCSQRLLDEMRRRGVRVTPQRSVILETVSHLGGHPTAVEVYRGASRRLPGLNQATVYRALEALREAGMVVGMSGADGGARFALRDQSHPHHHLVCTGCGAEVEVEPDAVARLANTVRRRHRFHLHGEHLTLSGLCEACFRARQED
jgi:Fe2+ or Zn2+ uptake regulation protein